MTYTDIANLIPTMQSVALVSENMKFVNKKKKNTTDFVKNATKNIVGIELMKTTASFI